MKGFVAILTALGAFAWAAASPEASTARSRPASQAAIKGLSIDRAARAVVIDATVQIRQDPLEFLLCQKGFKEHETLLLTEVRPSAVHAALLALGLTPGRPARWAAQPGKEPVFVSAEGALLEITVRWTDKDGKARVSPVTDWLLAAGTRKAAPATRWVFVGSDFLDDGVYWADAEGQVVTVSNFASSVIDVPFRSSDQQALLEFLPNPEVVPAKGTAVRLVITPVKGAETAPVARISFDVDDFGRIFLDGSPLQPEQIAAAVKKFLSRHAQGCADVRLAEQALVFDRERLKRVLEDAGLKDITFRTASPTGLVHPRTPEQAAATLEWWKRQFAMAKDLISDPGDDAEAVLKDLQRQQRLLDARLRLWADYAAALKGLAAQFRAQQDKEKEKAKPQE